MIFNQPPKEVAGECVMKSGPSVRNMPRNVGEWPKAS